MKIQFNIGCVLICLFLSNAAYCQTYYADPEDVISKYQFSDSKEAFKLKTNIAFLAASVANIGVEYLINDRLSVDFPVVFSPYNLKSGGENSYAKKLRLFGFQPEIRYWLSSPMDGLFVGFHTHFLWYNVTNILDGNREIRYQDTDDKPLWGFGISYGYSMKMSQIIKGMSDNFGMEFSLGLGYAKMYYDRFYNIPNGRKYSSDTRSYWGVTRVGVNFTYRFDFK